MDRLPDGVILRSRVRFSLYGVSDKAEALRFPSYLGFQKLLTTVGYQNLVCVRCGVWDQPSE